MYHLIKKRNHLINIKGSFSKYRSFSTSHLKNKSAIITGSTSGIGLAIAQSLASHGVNVTLNGFGDANSINQLMNDIRTKYNVKVIFDPCDVSKPDQIRTLVNRTLKEFGSADILVNNAGIQYVSKIEEFPEDQWNLIMDINLNACFHSIKAVLPLMRERGWGRIINISSVHGLVGSVNKSAYVAAKHGVVGLTKVVALETAGSGITINNICPGWVLTPLVKKQIEMRAKEKDIPIEEAELSLLSEKMPSKQFVKPEDIANMVIFLCGNESSQITGTSIPIDGAWTAQ